MVLKPIRSLKILTESLNKSSEFFSVLIFIFHYILIIWKNKLPLIHFDKIDIRVGTVISVKKNEKARKPSLVVEVDFGEEIGIKQIISSNYPLL